MLHGIIINNDIAQFQITLVNKNSIEIVVEWLFYDTNTWKVIITYAY